MTATDNLLLKTVSGFEIKDADRGEVAAVVSVFDVVDRDRDVVLRGAISDGTQVKISAYGHDVILEGKPPAGKGIIRIEGDRAVLYGKYFMSTERGRDAFAQVKEMGTDSEWSVGFLRKVQIAPMTDDWRAKGARRLIAKMNAVESSPVFLAANQFTETVSVKGGDAAAEPDDAEERARVTEIVEVVLKHLRASRAALDEKRSEVAAETTETEHPVVAEVAPEPREPDTASPLVRLAEEQVATAEKAAADAALVVKAAERERIDRVYERFQQTMRSVR